MHYRIVFGIFFTTLRELRDWKVTYLFSRIRANELLSRRGRQLYIYFLLYFFKTYIYIYTLLYEGIISALNYAVYYIFRCRFHIGFFLTRKIQSWLLRKFVFCFPRFIARKNYSVLFFPPFHSGEPSRRLATSYKCLNFNSPRPENFVIPNVLVVRCMSYIRAALYAHTRARLSYTQARFTCSQFYVPPCTCATHSPVISHPHLSLSLSLLCSFPIKLRSLTRALINNTSQG